MCGVFFIYYLACKPVADDGALLQWIMVKYIVKREDIENRKDVRDYILGPENFDRARELYAERHFTTERTLQAFDLGEWYEGNGNYFSAAFRYHMPRPGSKKVRPYKSVRQQLRKQVLASAIVPVEEGKLKYRLLVATAIGKDKYRVYEKLSRHFPNESDIKEALEAAKPASRTLAQAHFGNVLSQQLTE